MLTWSHLNAPVGNLRRWGEILRTNQCLYAGKENVLTRQERSIPQRTLQKIPVGNTRGEETADRTWTKCSAFMRPSGHSLYCLTHVGREAARRGEMFPMEKMKYACPTPARQNPCRVSLLLRSLQVAKGQKAVVSHGKFLEWGFEPATPARYQIAGMSNTCRDVLPYFMMRQAHQSFFPPLLTPGMYQTCIFSLLRIDGQQQLLPKIPEHHSFNKSTTTHQQPSSLDENTNTSPSDAQGFCKNCNMVAHG